MRKAEEKLVRRRIMNGRNETARAVGKQHKR